jgi:hypothetical protein
MCERKLAIGLTRGQPMNDIGIIAPLVFVLIWYALTLIGRALMKPYEKLKLTWCPELRRLSFVEADAISKGSGASVSVKRCLLWPEHKSCKEGCLRQGQSRV